MEIAGNIKSKHVDHIRLVTSDRHQEIDVFYTEVNKFDVDELTESQQVLIDVKIQSTDFYSLKLGKFWLRRILFPTKPPRKSTHRGKGNSDIPWAANRMLNNKLDDDDDELVT